MSSPRASPDSVIATALDSYEAAARALSELGWAFAAGAELPQLRWLAATAADAARDLAAVQLSITRWLLDL